MWSQLLTSARTTSWSHWSRTGQSRPGRRQLQAGGTYNLRRLRASRLSLRSATSTRCSRTRLLSTAFSISSGATFGSGYGPSAQLTSSRFRNPCCCGKWHEVRMGSSSRPLSSGRCPTLLTANSMSQFSFGKFLMGATANSMSPTSCARSSSPSPSLSRRLRSLVSSQSRAEYVAPARTSSSLGPKPSALAASSPRGFRCSHDLTR